MIDLNISVTSKDTKHIPKRDWIPHNSCGWWNQDFTSDIHYISVVWVMIMKFPVTQPSISVSSDKITNPCAQQHYHNDYQTPFPVTLNELHSTYYLWKLLRDQELSKLYIISGASIFILPISLGDVMNGEKIKISTTCEYGDWNFSSKKNFTIEFCGCIHDHDAIKHLLGFGLLNNFCLTSNW